LFGIAAKLVGGFSPRLQLGRSLKLERRLLLLDLLAEALDVFLDLGLRSSRRLDCTRLR
jgi:ABC-type taurine transport system ATPase subunit